MQIDVFTLVPHAFGWLTEQRPLAAVLGTEIDLRLHGYRDTTPLANGQVDEGEAAYANRYAGWTPRLLRAAYNYQYATKDPGAFAHNGKYALQTLHDALEDLGRDVRGITRP